MFVIIMVLFAVTGSALTTNVTIAYADGNCKNMNKTGLDMEMNYAANASVLGFVLSYPPLRQIKPVLIHGGIKTNYDRKQLRVEIKLLIEGDLIVDAIFNIRNLSGISCHEYTFKEIREICLLSMLEKSPQNSNLFFCLELGLVDFEKTVIRGVDMGCFWANSTFIDRDPGSESPPVEKFLRVVGSCDSATDLAPDSPYLLLALIFIAFFQLKFT